MYVCVYVCVCVGVLSDFTDSYFFSACIYIYIYMCVCVCVCVCKRVRLKPGIVFFSRYSSEDLQLLIQSLSYLPNPLRSGRI